MVKGTLFHVKRFLLCFLETKISSIPFSDEVCRFFFVVVVLFVLFQKQTQCLLVEKIDN